jgi:phosphoglycerate dehydrogenase-like enzyme
VADSLNVLIVPPWPFSDQAVQRVCEVNPRVRVDYRAGKSAADLADAWAETDVLYSGGPLPAPDQAPRLKWVHGHYAGINVFLGKPIISRLRISCNSGVAAANIGEYVLMMMLMFSRRLTRLLAYQARSDWPADRWNQFMPRELRGLTVGIIGYGSIGREVARLARSFGMQVLATKRDPTRLSDDSWQVPGVGDPVGNLAHRIYPPDRLHEVLPQCDFLVVAVPLSSATRHLIGASELQSMKRDAILINVARGDVVDERALIEALRDGVIAGAGLDVFEREPLPADSPLWQMPNVVISPHISGLSPLYGDRAMALLAENLRRYLEGEALLNEVNIATGAKLPNPGE